MSLDFCRDIEAIVSEFGIENMKAWLPSAVYKQHCWVSSVAVYICFCINITMLQKNSWNSPLENNNFIPYKLLACEHFFSKSSGAWSLC